MAHYDWYCDSCNWEGGIYKDEREQEYIPLIVPGITHKKSTATLCSKCLSEVKEGAILRFTPCINDVVNSYSAWVLDKDVLVPVIDKGVVSD